MKKTFTIIVIAMFFAVNLSFGQSHRELPIYRYFNSVAPDSVNPLDSTDITYGGWSVQSVTGTANWYVGHYTTTGNYYAHCNGYLVGATESWFISPGFSTIDYPNAKLKFSSCQKFTGMSIQILVSTDYDGLGLPATATWTDITSSCILPPANPSGPRVWYSSGYVDLSTYVDDNVYVAYKYICDAIEATDWEVDSISIINSGVGIPETESKNQNVTVCPNPASDMIYINNAKGSKLVEISNLLGQNVQQENITNGNACINISNLPRGIYFVSFLNEQGMLTIKKFIKD